MCRSFPEADAAGRGRLPSVNGPQTVTVIGGGLAGCEAALQLARRGIRVSLIEMKRLRRTPAQHSDLLAELVCSNSLRGAALTNAVGLLKEELRLAGSAVMSCALATRVPAGGALAVDRQRFAELMTETVHHSDAIALSHLEAISAARIDEVITLTQKEISNAKAEKDAVQATLCSLQADATMIEQLKTQLIEFQNIGELCNSEVSKVQQRVRHLTETQVVLQSSLDASRAREMELEQTLTSKATAETSEEGNTIDAVAAADNSTKPHTRSGSLEEGEERMEVDTTADGPSSTTTTTTTPSKPLKRSDFQLLVDHSRARVDDLEKELQNASSNINDLIMEIETVATEEAKTRAQNGRLLQQIAECQSMQRVALEENLRLQNQIEDLRASNRDVETK